MKKTLSIIGALSAYCFLSSAQTNVTLTNSPLTLQTSQLPGGLGQLASDIGLYFTDAQPYFTNAAGLGIYGVYGTRNFITTDNPNPKKQFGGFIDVSVPTPAGPQLSLDFALGIVSDGHTTRVYDAAVAPNLGTTFNLPLIGKTYTWIESGPGYDFQTKSAILHNAAGLTKGIKLSSKFELDLTGGALYLSDQTGAGFFGGLMFRGSF